MRVGIFGGTFDPVHVGHLQVAEAAESLFSLDRVYFVPAGRPPHKQSLPHASAWDRFAMLVLATKGRDRFFVSTIELETEEKAYTVDTLAKLRALFGGDAELYFIIGADSFEEITTWKDYERLFSLANFIVMSRPERSLEFKHLPPSLREQVMELSAGQTARPERGHRIYLCRAVSNEASATAIRDAIRSGRAIDGWVVPDVAGYITKYRLYVNIDEANIRSENETSHTQHERRPVDCH
jgi:nicotinate-nucleotide adenylyltransferase